MTEPKKPRLKRQPDLEPQVAGSGMTVEQLRGLHDHVVPGARPRDGLAVGVGARHRAGGPLGLDSRVQQFYGARGAHRARRRRPMNLEDDYSDLHEEISNLKARAEEAERDRNTYQATCRELRETLEETQRAVRRAVEGWPNPDDDTHWTLMAAADDEEIDGDVVGGLRHMLRDLREYTAYKPSPLKGKTHRTRTGGSMKEREQPKECDREGCNGQPTHVEYAWAVAGDDRLFLCRPHAVEARQDGCSWGGEPLAGDGVPVEGGVLAGGGDVK